MPALSDAFGPWDQGFRVDSSPSSSPSAHAEGKNPKVSTGAANQHKQLS